MGAGYLKKGFGLGGGGGGGGRCGQWHGGLGRGLVSSGRHCSGEMKVCHHLLYLLVGLLELVGELLVGDSKVCHRLSLVSRGLEVGGGSGGQIVESFCGGSSVGVVGVRAGRGNTVVTFTLLFYEEHGFEGSPRSCYGQEFMPFSHGEGGTLGFCDGAGRDGEGLPFGVGLAGLVCHEEAVLNAVEVGFEVCGAVVGGPEPLVVHRELRGSDRPVGPVKVLENVPYGAGGEARHAVPEILDIDVVDGVDELVFEGIVDRFEEAEFARGFLMLAFRVSDLSVGGSRCYDRMNARVQRDDE